METNITTGFRHEAMFYDDLAGFVDRTGSFIREGLGLGEASFVVVNAEKIGLLRDAVGPSERVRFADMADVGRNPALIIPAWRTFVDEVQGGEGGFRGVGEPIWAARSSAELEESERHEALLNVAFADAPPWRLLCPYDTSTLPAAVLREAERNHPFLWDQGSVRSSATYRGLEDAAEPWRGSLGDPGDLIQERPFEAGDLHAIRAEVRSVAATFGFEGPRAEEIVLVADELAANSIRHGGGTGHLRMWRSERSLLIDVIDRGAIHEPLAGRERPIGMDGGYGLWISNQLADLVQIRASDDGSIVRTHFDR